MSRPDGRASRAQPRMHPRHRFVLFEEIAADVDAMEDELVTRGMSRASARAAAIRRLYPGPEAVRALEVDRVPYRRFADRFGGRRIALAERVGLALVAATMGAGLAASLGRADAIGGSPFSWAVVVVISLLVAHTIRVAIGLWVKQDMDARRRRTAWRTQCGLILLAVCIGGTGAAIEAYRAAAYLEVTPGWQVAFAALGDVLTLTALALGAIVIGLSGWMALTPSLRAYELFEIRLRTLFSPAGPRPVADPGPGSDPIPIGPRLRSSTPQRREMSR